jgi:hypothetical protein
MPFYLHEFWNAQRVSREGAISIGAAVQPETAATAAYQNGGGVAADHFRLAPRRFASMMTADQGTGGADVGDGG